MHVKEPSDWLDSPSVAASHLNSWGLNDFDLGLRNLRAIAGSLGLDSLAVLLPFLGQFLPGQADPDMALNNLERFLANPLARSRLPALLDAQARGLDVVIQIFSASQFFSDLLAANPDDLDVVEGPMRRNPTVDELTDELQKAVAGASDDSAVLRALRRFRQRQHLRIGVNDIIRDRPLEEITRDLSSVAEAVIEVALGAAIRNMSNRFGSPRIASGEPSRCIVLGFGKLGGEELNYSSDIDLMVIYDFDGQTEGKRLKVENDEFYSRCVAELVRLLSVHTDRGQAYRVDLRLRPEGQRGALARSLASTLSYYDTLGRTWERQRSSRRVPSGVIANSATNSCARSKASSGAST